MCVFSFLFPIALLFISQPEIGPLVTGAFGVFLFATSLFALGVAASAFCARPIYAGALSMAVFFTLYTLHAPAEFVAGNIAQSLYSFSPLFHLRDFIRGVLTLSGSFYFISLALLGLLLCYLSLAMRSNPK